jgi:hypothetical protein
MKWIVCFILTLMGFQAFAGTADLSKTQLETLSRNILAKSGIQAKNIKVGPTLDLGTLIARVAVDTGPAASSKTNAKKNNDGTINKLQFQVKETDHTLNYSCFLVVQSKRDDVSVQGCNVDMKNHALTQIAAGSISDGSISKNLK